MRKHYTLLDDNFLACTVIGLLCGLSNGCALDPQEANNTAMYGNDELGLAYDDDDIPRTPYEPCNANHRDLDSLYEVFAPSQMMPPGHLDYPAENWQPPTAQQVHAAAAMIEELTLDHFWGAASFATTAGYKLCTLDDS